MIFGLIGLAVGAACGAFSTYAVMDGTTEENRQKAKRYEKQSKKFQERYQDLERKHIEYVDKSKEELSRKDRKLAQLRLERDQHALIVELQQALYPLIFEIDQQPTKDRLDKLHLAVLQTNIVLDKFNLKQIEVPPGYYHRNYMRAYELDMHRELTKTKHKASKSKDNESNLIIQCSICLKRNRVSTLKLNHQPICGYCKYKLEV